MLNEKMLVFRCIDENVKSGVKIFIISEVTGRVTQCLEANNPKEIGAAEQIIARRATFGDLVSVAKGDLRLITAFEKMPADDFFKPYLGKAKKMTRDTSCIGFKTTIQRIVEERKISIDEERVLRYKVQHDPDFIFAACEHYGLEAITCEYLESQDW